MAINRIPVDLPKTEQPTPEKKVPEKKIQAFINRGGKPTSRSEGVSESGGTKSIKLTMTDQEMKAVKEVRDKRSKPRGRKIPISVHDWVIEAIQEKLEREQKKYGIMSK